VCGTAARETPWEPSQPATIAQRSSSPSPKRISGRAGSISVASASKRMSPPAAIRSFTTSCCP
jgi:hypothetical protein